MFLRYAILSSRQFEVLFCQSIKLATFLHLGLLQTTVQPLELLHWGAMLCLLPNLCASFPLHGRAKGIYKGRMWDKPECLLLHAGGLCGKLADFCGALYAARPSKAKRTITYSEASAAQTSHPPSSM